MAPPSLDPQKPLHFPRCLMRTDDYTAVKQVFASGLKRVHRAAWSGGWDKWCPLKTTPTGRPQSPNGDQRTIRATASDREVRCEALSRTTSSASGSHIPAHSHISGGEFPPGFPVTRHGHAPATASRITRRAAPSAPKTHLTRSWPTQQNVRAIPPPPSHYCATFRHGCWTHSGSNWSAGVSSGGFQSTRRSPSDASTRRRIRAEPQRPANPYA